MYHTLFNYHYQTKEATHKGHGESVDQLCWHPSNPDLLVTASGDKTIRIWDARGMIDCSSHVFLKKEFVNKQRPCFLDFMNKEAIVILIFNVLLY